MKGQQAKAKPKTRLFALIESRVTIVWIVLMVLTIANPVLGIEAQLAGSTSVQLLGVAILTLAIVKVRLVGLDFMELRKAPVPMRLMFEAYCLILWVVLTACFLWL
ncbi:cytochrome C oxidase subunit IV family protein [Arthrobacter sp. HMWF013]|uniref:cytochrome C oxidase subunit IV family protein n=1 Tax=Arthrobacter sp. HMWF013 TaxID=2056849 RepID=UPI000D351DE1|nr:cytochrome C oxidase subunit IV family protein [Arthrobacter sp. HMWF013]PTT63106.1 hypothetical protein DBR22_16285 [Arthrobacter sp. HMWF013]